MDCGEIAQRPVSASVRQQRRRVTICSAVEQTVSDDLFVDYKPTSAFLFPGQGAQYVGMAKEVCDYPEEVYFASFLPAPLCYSTPVAYVRGGR